MTITADTLVPEQLWLAIQPLLPAPPHRYGGRPRVDDRAALAGIVYQLRTGVPWRLLPTASSAAAVRSPAGGACATGNVPGCGGGCTTCCWTSSAAAASSTGREPLG
jgi:transposase